jgi:hypothetical protein
MNKEYLKMTTTIPQLCSIDLPRPLGGLEHFFSLNDQHRAVHFAMAAQIAGWSNSKNVTIGQSQRL